MEDYWHPEKNPGLTYEANNWQPVWFQCPCGHEWQGTTAALERLKKRDPCPLCRWPASRKRVKRILDQFLSSGQICSYQYDVPIPGFRLKMDFRVDVTSTLFFYCWAQQPIFEAKHLSKARAGYIKNWERRKDWCREEGHMFLELPPRGDYKAILEEWIHEM